MATGPQHYQRAEELLADITGDDGSVDFGDGGEAYALAAIGHALLAVAAAAALGGNLSGPNAAEWGEVAAVRPRR